MSLFRPSSLNATHLTASVYGILVGFAGVEHGIFEIFQGNVKPDGIWINAIGLANNIWEGASEPAITVIPSFLITGVLSAIVGLIIIIWSSKYIQVKYGRLIFTILAIVQFFVGGGFAPIFISILTLIAAARINKPNTWWRNHMPAITSKSFASVWLIQFVVFVILFFITVEIAIFGWFFGVSDPTDILNSLAYYMLIPMVLAVPTSIAFDIHKQSEKGINENINNI